MSLQLLTETSAISVYLDTENHWIYVDWQGDLTLPVVQASCLTIARYVLLGSYTKVLNDNTNVLSLSPDVSPWLANEYLPYVTLGGVKYIAWVYSPNMSTQCYTDIALFNLDSPVVALFSDTASACMWLQGARFTAPAAQGSAAENQDLLLQVLKSRKDAAPLVAALENRSTEVPGSLPNEN
ncbi:hypothetical protein [Hymenobacter sp. DG01]|uniref:hypothetical protein n=1 Tax=Hymenobacter sp. DG01 TaxID=2584940 RepID=UPI001120DB76|nr:hypothetical protein [Hymenobacter sp. DG01]